MSFVFIHYVQTSLEIYKLGTDERSHLVGMRGEKYQAVAGDVVDDRISKRPLVGSTE